MEWNLSSVSLVVLSIILLIKQGLCADETKTVKTTTPDPESKAIWCYDCNSRDDPRCGHPFKKHAFKPINCYDLKYLDEHSQDLMKAENKTTPYLCRKNYQTVTLGGKTDTRIVRGCGFLPKNKPKYGVEEEDDTEGEDRCYRKAGTFEVMVTYCTCTESECNGADYFLNKNHFLLVLFGLIFGSILNLPTLNNN